MSRVRRARIMCHVFAESVRRGAAAVGRVREATGVPRLHAQVRSGGGGVDPGAGPEGNLLCAKCHLWKSSCDTIKHKFDQEFGVMSNASTSSVLDQDETVWSPLPLDPALRGNNIPDTKRTFGKLAQHLPSHSCLATLVAIAGLHHSVGELTLENCLDVTWTLNAVDMVLCTMLQSCVRVVGRGTLRLRAEGVSARRSRRAQGAVSPG